MKTSTPPLLNATNHKLAIIIPCYNEEATIAQVIDELFALNLGAQIFVFDNNSTDKSAQIVREKIAQLESEITSCSVIASGEATKQSKRETKDKNEIALATALPRNDEKGVTPLNDGADSTQTKNTSHADSVIASSATAGRSNLAESKIDSKTEIASSPSAPRNDCIKSKTPQTLHLYSVTTQGKGAVIREAFSIIDATHFVIIDADTQYDTSILPTALEHFKKHKLDMLNITRTPQNSSIHRPGHSFGNALFTKGASMLFGREIRDMLSGYRIFSRGFVKSFPAHSNGFEIETELSIFAAQQKLRVEYMPAPYKSRPEGSFSKLSTFKDGFKILGMLMYLLFSERPLFVFSILSIVCLVFGIGLGVPIVAEFLETSKVARFPTLFAVVGLGVVSLVLFVTGLILSMVAKSIKENRYLTYLNVK